MLGALLLPALSLAYPSNSGHVVCLTPDAASSLVTGFASLLTDFNATVANKLLASNFTDTSDSIDWLGGFPLDTTTFPSKEAFIDGQGSQPSIGFQVLSIDAVTCNVIAFRWVAQVGSKQYEVKGINILYAINTAGTQSGWQIQTVYSEFNSAAWVVDIGRSCTFGP